MALYDGSYTVQEVGTQKTRRLEKWALTVVAASILSGCTKAADTDTRAIDSPERVVSRMYRTIQEPFAAHYLYTAKQGNNTSDVLVSVVQDEQMDIKITRTEQRSGGISTYVMAGGSVYLQTGRRFQGRRDGAVALGGAWERITGQGILAEKARPTEFPNHGFGLRTPGDALLAARNPAAIVTGESSMPIPRSCFYFMSQRPEAYVIKLRENIWRIKCDAVPGVISEFVVTFDTDGRITRLNHEDGREMFDLSVAYGHRDDVTEPGTLRKRAEAEGLVWSLG